jgi:Na+-translocating ferredoxin:NAD+ oxidoreductase RnfE subunit
LTEAGEIYEKLKTTNRKRQSLFPNRQRGIKMAKTIAQEFTKGLWDEIPPFRLVLGLCPGPGRHQTRRKRMGMGLATTFVLVGSNVLVSILRKAIPKKVRIACFIIIIATFVTVVELVMQAFAYPLFLKLGIFIPLIVVNCIVLGRAEAFASKNNVIRSTWTVSASASVLPWRWRHWVPFGSFWDPAS